MTLIDRAARALAEHETGTNRWDELSAAERDRHYEAVRAVLHALREADEDMKDAGSEVIRAVHKGETDDAYRNDAANAWRFMVDAAVGRRRTLP
jgi:hypothetical protein